MDGGRIKFPERGNPDAKRQTYYEFPYMWMLAIKSVISKLYKHGG